MIISVESTDFKLAVVKVFEIEKPGEPQRRPTKPIEGAHPIPIPLP